MRLSLARGKPTHFALPQDLRDTNLLIPLQHCSANPIFSCSMSLRTIWISTLWLGTLPFSSLTRLSD